MTYKTSEMYHVLKIVRDEKPFKEEEVAYARLNQWNHQVIVRERLIKIRPILISHLKGKGLLTETFSSCQLTTYGLHLLKEFEEKKAEFGVSNIELIPAMIESKVTYKIRVNPKVNGIQPPKITPKPSKKQTLIEEFA
jgi:hypothetical protein